MLETALFGCLVLLHLQAGLIMAQWILVRILTKVKFRPFLLRLFRLIDNLSGLFYTLVVLLAMLFSVMAPEVSIFFIMLSLAGVIIIPFYRLSVIKEEGY